MSLAECSLRNRSKPISRLTSPQRFSRCDQRDTDHDFGAYVVTSPSCGCMYVDVGLYLVCKALAVPEDHHFGDLFLAYSVHARTASPSWNTSRYWNSSTIQYQRYALHWSHRRNISALALGSHFEDWAVAPYVVLN